MDISFISIVLFLFNMVKLFDHMHQKFVGVLYHLNKSIATYHSVFVMWESVSPFWILTRYLLLVLVISVCLNHYRFRCSIVLHPHNFFFIISFRSWQLVQILYWIALTWMVWSFHKYSVLLHQLSLSHLIQQGYVPI